jgi:hypothetical protein
MSAHHLPSVGTATLSDAGTPLQETLVSALLTTDSSFVDLLVDSGGGEDTQLLPLTGIFHCSFIKECGKTFSPRYQSRALWHVLKIKLGVLLFALP